MGPSFSRRLNIPEAKKFASGPSIFLQAPYMSNVARSLDAENEARWRVIVPALEAFRFLE